MIIELKYTIARNVEGISLNGREYILNLKNKIRQFNLKETLEIIGVESIEEAEEQYSIFIEPIERDIDNQIISAKEKL